MSKRGTPERKNMRRVSVLVTAQTLWNLEKLAAMAGYGDKIGRVIDKLTRDHMVQMEESLHLDGRNHRG